MNTSTKKGKKSQMPALSYSKTLITEYRSKENRKSSNGINAKFSNIKSTRYWINISRSKGIKYYV